MAVILLALRSSFIAETEKDDPFVGIFVPKYFLLKVFVVCYQDTIFSKCLFDDLIILYPPRFFVNRKNFMALFF